MSADVGDDLVVSRRVTIPAGELTWHFSRSSGPGGQSVNTTDSKVELRWDGARSRALSPTQRARLLSRIPQGLVVVVASDHRSQWQNRRLARERLAERVRTAVAPPPPTRRPTRPSRASVERRLRAKRRRGEVKRGRRGTDDGA
jgi:ribosome-associated protein